MTARTAHLRRITATAALALAMLGSVVTGASADAQSEYVASLVARADAAKPYSQSEAYVRTLVYWHHNPDWGFGS